MKILKKLNVVSYKLDKLLDVAGVSISDEIAKELQAATNELPAKKKITFKSKDKTTV